VTPLRPFFSYYGSKWLLAKHYPQPEHDLIIEPFAGSAGYATRYHDRNVVLSDTNPIIAGVWNYLIKSRASTIMKLPAPVDCVDDLHACQEARWLVGFWLGRASHGPRRTLSAWGRDGRWPMCFWGESIRERIARQVEYIRHWKVHHTSYENFYPPVLKHVKATWFVDPPYERQGKYYNGEALNYPALAEWCRERRGQVIVCENEGAKWLPFKPFRTARANSSRGKGRVSHEVIWTS